jgi:hypothetical protein
VLRLAEMGLARRVGEDVAIKKTEVAELKAWYLERCMMEPPSHSLCSATVGITVWH